MSEIIESVPWACGERDCSAGWHLATYWIDDDGTYTVDNYTDGDHEEIDRPPTSREIATAWLAYWRDVLATGEDPLGEIAGRHVIENRAWQIVVGNSIVGPSLIKARPAHRDPSSVTGFRGRGAWLWAEEIPEHVAQFVLFDKVEKFNRPWTLCIKKSHAEYCQMIRESDEATVQDNAITYHPGGLVFFVRIERKITLPPSAATVRKIARKNIKDWTMLRDEDPPCIRCGAPESVCECDDPVAIGECQDCGSPVYTSAGFCGRCHPEKV